jgi:hypothetical protein
MVSRRAFINELSCGIAESVESLIFQQLMLGIAVERVERVINATVQLVFGNIAKKSSSVQVRRESGSHIV